MKTTTKFVVSTSLMMVAISAMTAVKDNVKLPEVTANADMKAAIDSALAKRIVQDRINGSFDVVVSAFKDKAGKSLEDIYFKDKGLQLASWQDSTYGVYSTTVTGSLSCYANCHSACHSACHGSRGWR